MNWIEVSLTVHDNQAEMVADVFASQAHGGVVLEPTGRTFPKTPIAATTVRAYLPLDGELEEKKLSLEQGLRDLLGGLPPSQLKYSPIESEDWAHVWMDHYRPIHVGHRLVIQPAWLPQADTGRETVLIDPGMAFGTGTHATTRLCLELLESLLEPGMVVADLGCGSGILGIAAAKLGARLVLSLDIDPVAIEASEANVRRNGMSNQFRIGLGSLDRLVELIAEIGAAPDILVANILAPELESMLASGLERGVRRGGWTLLSGILDTQVQGIRTLAEGHGFRYELLRGEDEWRALVLTKGPPLD